MTNIKWIVSVITVVCFAVDSTTQVKTCGGTAGGADCVFPFWFKFKKYDACTMDDETRPWCSVTKMFFGNGKWGYCDCDVRHAAVTCPSPNGGDKTYTPGEAITYGACNTGFKMIGNATRTCLSDGSWTGTVPECKAVTCPSPNGGDKTYTPGEAITYGACNASFEMIGDATRTCLSDGSWTGTVPECKAVTCPSPNGGDKTYTPGETITYEACNEGFKMVGNATRTCRSDGSWTGTVPECKATCPSPNGGDKTYIPGDTITYGACNEGFEMIGNATRTCRSDGSWTGTVPGCKAVVCPSPNGGNKTYSPGDTITYGACNTGFKMIGNATRTCLSDGSWTGTVPECKAVTCPSPNVGTKIYTPGDTNTYGPCDEGFKMFGNATRTCLSDGSWTGTVPECKAITCSVLPVVAHSTNDGGTNHTSYNDHVTFNCNPGYEYADGASSETIKCTSMDTWDTMISDCQVCWGLQADIMFLLDTSGSVGAPNFKKITNFVKGVVEKFDIGPNKTRVGVVKFSGAVYPVFELNDHTDKITLMAAISGVTFRAGGTRTGKGLKYLRAQSFTTAKGDRPDVPDIAVVVTDGKSNSKANTITQAKKLHDKGVKVFAIGIGKGIINTELNVIGSDPDSKFVFTVDTFDALTAFKDMFSKRACKAVTCPSPNGDSKTYTHGDIITYGPCDEGFKMIGNTTRTCLSGGSWTGTVPDCKAVTCPSPNGDNKTYTPGDTHTLGPCTEGFKMFGNATRTCLSDGSWTGAVPECKGAELSQGSSAVSAGPTTAASENQNLCEPVNPCNAGTCTPDGASFTCVCPSDATGVYCESALVIECEKETLHISCEKTNEVLTIVSAMYGRNDNVTCGCGDTRCAASSSLSQMQTRCDGLGQCSVVAGNDVFGEPCQGTLKYLAVGYKCAAPVNGVTTLPLTSTASNKCEPNPCHTGNCTPDGASFTCVCPLGTSGKQCDRASATVCESETMELACAKTGNVLIIVSAIYGRDDSVMCGGGVNTSCAASSALDEMKHRCSGNNRCSVIANNDVFGDPCSGTLKYLTVEYECVASTVETTSQGGHVSPTLTSAPFHQSTPSTQKVLPTQVTPKSPPSAPKPAHSKGDQGSSAQQPGLSEDDIILIAVLVPVIALLLILVLVLAVLNRRSRNKDAKLPKQSGPNEIMREKDTAKLINETNDKEPFKPVYTATGTVTPPPKTESTGSESFTPKYT